MEDPELAALQAAMIEAFMTDRSADDVRSALLAEDLPETTRAWIRQWDPRSVEVARSIVARWVVRADDAITAR